MAIYHASMKPISRGSGRSAVAASAYRAGVRLTNERDGITHDFTRKQGIAHAEIVLPEGADADWALDRSALWNAAEAAENRKDARVAREFEVALPHELTAEQRLELTREFALDLANRYGGAIDFAIHEPHGGVDVRNHHAHLMMTTRTVGPDGLGDKTHIERENKWLLANELPTSHMQLRDIRQAWEGHANQHLARAGLDIRIDHRSHSERGLEVEPTEHMGVHASQMKRRGGDVSRSRLDENAARRNAELIREKPEQVLTIITGEKSVFDRHDIARTLHRYINDDAQAFQNAFSSVMASPALVELQPESDGQLARYSTRETIQIETDMARSITGLAEAKSHHVGRGHVERALGKQDVAIRSAVSHDTAGKVARGEMSEQDRARVIGSAGLSDEQRAAIEHITGPERISVVVGFAGAGKSTMLAAAREAWEAQGYRVHGAALAGKAAEGLEESSGIASRTLASWEYGWQAGRNELGKGDVLVIDEAGMIGTRQFQRVVREVEARGAKVVPVGDGEQLGAIGAGSPFRVAGEIAGHVELQEVRRQRADWQRAASVAFGRQCTQEALGAYNERGAIRFSDTRDEARGQMVRDYLADREQRPEGTRVAMAHRRADVRALNAEIRSTLQERGALAKGVDAGELEFATNDGKRAFAPGDRIVFLENNRDLGVKNGMLGTVQAVEADRPDAGSRSGAGSMIVVQLDGPGSGEGRSVSISAADYKAFDHGYATTIHKNQGATVDRAFVLASGTMDRHLTYVAMTRHRDEVGLYAGRDEFSHSGRHADQRLAAGRLVEHGAAPYEHKPGNRGSYFVRLEGEAGQKRTVWGVDLERAMKAAAPQIGERIGLERTASQPVRLTDGAQAGRNGWTVRTGDDLAYRQLENRLSRSGLKEMAIDYVRDFADRRGLAARAGVRSEIDIPRDREHAGSERQAQQQPRMEAEKHGEDLGRDPLPKDFAPDQGDDRRQDQRRSRFEGLKLGLGAAGERAKEPQGRSEAALTQRRGMFSGLRLNVGREAATGPGERSEMDGGLQEDAPSQDRLAERIGQHTGFEQSVDRFARAWSATDKMQQEGRPLLEGQKAELRSATQDLDKHQPGASELLVSALRHDEQTERAMHELTGRERVEQLSKGMDRERVNQANPQVRAERFIERWQYLDSERERLGRGSGNAQERGKVETEMRSMAKTLERDPQAESLVRERSNEMGIGPERQDQTIAQRVEQKLEQRERNREIER